MRESTDLRLSHQQSVSSCSCSGGHNTGEDSPQCSSTCLSWSLKAKHVSLMLAPLCKGIDTASLILIILLQYQTHLIQSPIKDLIMLRTCFMTKLETCVAKRKQMKRWLTSSAKHEVEEEAEPKAVCWVSLRGVNVIVPLFSFLWKA